ncbi:MAG: GtrA family protein [Coriobacteriia bacterium]|nr:GtrA family protein [Coriobacteriia bacterium]
MADQASEPMLADGVANDAAEAPSRGAGGLLAQLTKYCGVSFTQTFVELGVFLLLGAVGLPAKVANVFAIVASGSYNYVMNRNITFKASTSYARSVTLFVLLYCWNLLFCNVMLGLLPWPDAAVKLFTMGCQGVWGFLLCRYVIFK